MLLQLRLFLRLLQLRNLRLLWLLLGWFSSRLALVVPCRFLLLLHHMYDYGGGASPKNAKDDCCEVAKHAKLGWSYRHADHILHCSLKQWTPASRHGSTSPAASRLQRTSLWTAHSELNVREPLPQQPTIPAASHVQQQPNDGRSTASATHGYESLPWQPSSSPNVQPRQYGTSASWPYEHFERRFGQRCRQCTSHN